jgi:hypothetical protein
MFTYEGLLNKSFCFALLCNFLEDKTSYLMAFQEKLREYSSWGDERLFIADILRTRS